MAAVLDGALYAREGESRAFALAVVSSILLHAMILFGAPGLRDPPKPNRLTPGPIVARLAQPPAAPPPAPEEAPKPKVEEPSSPPPPVAKPQPPPSAKPVAVPKPAPATRTAPSAPAPSQTTSTTDTPRAPEPAPAAPAAPSAAPVAKTDPAPQVQVPPTPTGEVADPVTLSQYRIAIITAAKRYKRYPRVAMDNNWEGKVEIRMVIGANGMIASIGVKTGTGHEVLDTQALDMIRKAKPLAPIPAALRGKEFSVDVPVFFNLKDETG